MFGREGKERSEMRWWFSVLATNLRPLSPGECVSASEAYGARVAGARWFLHRLSGFLGELQRLFRKCRFLFCVAEGLGLCVEGERCLHLGPERG